MRISDRSSDVFSSDLVWEFAQIPRYTICLEGSPREIAFAALHCTGGDLLIAGAALVTAQLVAATGDWPHDRFAAVAAIAVFGGLGYTVFSEWLNTEIRGSWAYADVMPTLPLIGRSEEHTSELQSLMRISYAVFCLKKKQQ